MKRETMEGKCNLCGATFGKAGMAKHLQSCKQGKGAAKTRSGDRGPRTKWSFHLVVEGLHLPFYWMHLEVDADSDLSDLDRFLRRTWLECCGHMSAFTIGEQRYAYEPLEEIEEKSMDVSLGEVLSRGMRFQHEYDYGSTTELALRVVGEREGKGRGEPVRVLARNDPPPIPCDSCGKLATRVCSVCIWSGKACVCDKCAPKHECGEDMTLPVVNSPRVGVCAYTGPDDTIVM